MSTRANKKHSALVVIFLLEDVCFCEFANRTVEYGFGPARAEILPNIGPPKFLKSPFGPYPQTKDANFKDEAVISFPTRLS